MTQPRLHTSPLLSGVTLLGLGLVLRRWQPGAFDLPERDHGDERNDSRTQRVARYSRDGVARVMPRNLTGGIGRTLIVAGTCMIAIRALDLLVEDDDALY